MLKRLAITAFTTLIGTVAPTAWAADNATPPAIQTPSPAGQVWVNGEAGIFYRSTSRYYGKGAKGQWMPEAEAKAKGYRLAGSPGVKENPSTQPKAVAPGTGKPTKPTPSKPPAKPAKSR